MYFKGQAAFDLLELRKAFWNKSRWFRWPPDANYGEPEACGLAPRHIGCRDRFIGWRKEIRQKNLHLIAYNTRFLILRWVRVRFLASQLLGRIARVLAEDWQRIYNHRIYFLTTFIDTEKFTTTSHKVDRYRFAYFAYQPEPYRIRR